MCYLHSVGEYGAHEWKDWWNLAQRFTRVIGRKAFLPDGTREEVAFKRIDMWKVTSDHPWRVYFKYSRSKLEPIKYLDVRKTPSTRAMRPQDPKQANTNIKIKKSNYDDLQKAAAFVKPENKAFYKDLPYEGKSDDDSESDSEEYDYAEIHPFRFDDSWLTPRQQYVLL